MLHASETWPLTKPNLQRLQSFRAMIRQICNVRPQDIVTTRSNELLVRLGIVDLDLILKERRLMVWTCGTLQWCSQDSPLTYRLMESVGLGGPNWHGSSWQRGIAESGSSRLSTLMIDVPGDLVWNLPCVQQASYLEGGPLMWMLPLYLHANKKSDDMMIILLLSHVFFFLVVWGGLVCAGMVWGVSMDPKHTFEIFPHLQVCMISYLII